MDRSNWLEAWGVVTAVFAAIATFAATTPQTWAVMFFGTIAVIGLAMVFAPVFSYWPFKSLGKPVAEPRLQDLYPREDWAPYYMPIRPYGPWELVLGLDPPDALARQPALRDTRDVARVTLTAMADGTTWGPAVARPVLRSTDVTFAAVYPKDFKGGSPPAPLDSGRYTAAWEFQGRNHRHEFWIDGLREPGPIPPTAIEHLRNRTSARWKLLKGGFSDNGPTNEP